jgi:hypothetical protein
VHAPHPEFSALAMLEPDEMIVRGQNQEIADALLKLSVQLPYPK